MTRSGQLMQSESSRREFLRDSATLAAAGVAASCTASIQAAPPFAADAQVEPPRAPYRGPNVILVRFGGGVRRLETIADAARTWCPFIYHELARKQGVLFKNVYIESSPGIETSHGQGTLYLLTGKFDHYEDITHKPLSDRFEAKIPTIFECLRKQYDIPEHQTLIINGEDRISEEFYTFSNHHQFGVRYRSTVLSLYRFKSYLLRKELEDVGLSEKERAEKTKKLHEMEALDYRVRDQKVVSPALDQFWADWQRYYGKTGLVNPRGDRVLTALALAAIKKLRPKLLMINYQDPDYVHWGNPHFYTRAISIIDDGVRQIHDAVLADPEYRANTIFVVVPDCGRDNNRGMSVAYQHHFNSRTAHEIFAIASGPGVPKGVIVDKRRQQIAVASTIGHFMGFPTPSVDPAAGSLEEAFT